MLKIKALHRPQTVTGRPLLATSALSALTIMEGYKENTKTFCKIKIYTVYILDSIAGHHFL